MSIAGHRLNYRFLPLQPIARDKMNVLPKKEITFPLEEISFNKMSATQSAKLYLRG
jgi:hypothetical protein